MHSVGCDDVDGLPVVKYYADDRQLPESRKIKKNYAITESVSFKIAGVPATTEYLQCIIINGDKKLRNCVVKALNKYYANTNNIRRDFIGIKNPQRTDDLRQKNANTSGQKSNFHKSKSQKS